MQLHPKKIEMLASIPSNEDEQQTLEMFIGNMNLDMLHTFLRFVTESSVCLGNPIKVLYNRLSGVVCKANTHNLRLFQFETSGHIQVLCFLCEGF